MSKINFSQEDNSKEDFANYSAGLSSVHLVGQLALHITGMKKLLSKLL